MTYEEQNLKDANEAELYNKAWNEAIEAAAKIAEGNNTGTASTNQIRVLKK